jgi:hypothetical protein
MTLFFRLIISFGLYGAVAFWVKTAFPEYFSPYTWVACYFALAAIIFFATIREK